MRSIPLDQLPEAANLDAEFRLAARFWSCALRLENGGEAMLLRIRDGRLEEVRRVPTGHGDPGACDVRISAPAEEWSEFLRPVPRPFYQDLFGAIERHGFEIHGDLERFFPYYAAARRLFDLMRAARRS